MELGRTVLSATLALSLAACGGGGGNSGGGGGGVIGGGGGGTGGGDACSLSARQDWTFAQLNEWYLFPDLLDKTVNQASYNDVQSYIDALVAPARAQDKDRFFTYITSIQEENELINSGSNAGFGVRLSYDTDANRVFVVEAFENAPAFQANIDRGSELISINGQTVASLMASGGPQAVSQALGPSDPGVTRRLEIRQPDGSTFTVQVSKTEYALDPLSDRYGAKILNDGGRQVGYINLRTFIVQDAGPQLRQAFGQFKNRGIDEVILDLRYNGGGLISVAELLGDLMGADHVGDVFSITKFRPSKSENNETTRFGAEANAIAVSKLAVIGRGGTASASELVTNSFIPYLGNNLALIGTNTFGKPVGQIALDRSACDDRLRAVALKTTDKNGRGEYFDGLASVVKSSCRAADGILTPLGDPSEASISVALDFLAGRACTPITAAAKDGTIAAEGHDLQLLQSRAPTAAQFEIPGLF
ncbi:S41 family peptidase [Qipengyuania marisflavi]|uniref:Peptidase S41 n=1 Tax=Qipengyuania marisflavi TaxID=2486356 RepID=A0A5S3P1K5_9SPHN|nr:S41 family peptidase [Qipengyuania marisflavi]TMM46717.1 peptidase S41 [Qipengyuania marisflavi]